MRMLLLYHRVHAYATDCNILTILDTYQKPTPSGSKVTEVKPTQTLSLYRSPRKTAREMKGSATEFLPHKTPWMPYRDPVIPSQVRSLETLLCRCQEGPVVLNLRRYDWIPRDDAVYHKNFFGHPQRLAGLHLLMIYIDHH